MYLEDIMFFWKQTQCAVVVTCRLSHCTLHWHDPLLNIVCSVGCLSTISTSDSQNMSRDGFMMGYRISLVSLLGLIRRQPWSSLMEILLNLSWAGISIHLMKNGGVQKPWMWRRKGSWLPVSKGDLSSWFVFFSPLYSAVWDIGSRW